MKSIALTLASLLLTAAAASAVTLTSGHADIGVNFKVPGLTWDLHAHDGENNLEYEPGEVVFEVGSASAGFLPVDPAFGALSGAAAFTLPAIENPALVFLGFGTEELASGIFVADTVTFSLSGVAGPGQFVLWRDDGFGGVEVFMQNSSGFIELTAGGHEHYNLSFTASGSYALTFTAEGTLAPLWGGGITSDSATYAFQVIPEPGTWALLAGAAALVIALRRRR